MRINRYFLILPVLSVLLVACDPNRVYEENIDLKDFTWDIQNKPSFTFNIQDTTQIYRMYVNVRHASHYPFANIYVFATIHFPNGKTARDTVECILADETGQWRGEGMGDIWDNQFLWKPMVKFPLPGEYRIEYEHAMRVEKVPFVMDVGLRVEKAEGLPQR